MSVAYFYHSCFTHVKGPQINFFRENYNVKKSYIFLFFKHKQMNKNTFVFYFFQANEDSISSYGKHLRIVSIVSLLQPLSMKKYFAVMVASVLTSNLWSKFEGSCDRQMYRILVRSFYSFTKFLLRCSQTTRHGRSE